MHRGWVITTVFFASCSLSSNPVPVATDPPAPSGNTEVRLESRPPGAKILLGEAELGTTPMTIKITAQTSLILDLPGYVRQAVLLTPSSQPHLSVDLVPAPAAETQRPIAPTAAPKTTKASRSESPRKQSSAKSSSKSSSNASSPAPATPIPPGDSATKDPAASKDSSKPGKAFDTMRQVKEALRKGEIDRNGYKAAQTDIRRR
ncbi:MAG: PEGA domain-containing protein, partial [Myxococcota bacterium]|nr:PEGA domain-containing protein [Myxococcota bacterium]